MSLTHTNRTKRSQTGYTIALRATAGPPSSQQHANARRLRRAGHCLMTISYKRSLLQVGPPLPWARVRARVRACVRWRITRGVKKSRKRKNESNVFQKRLSSTLVVVNLHFASTLQGSPPPEKVQR